MATIVRPAVNACGELLGRLEAMTRECPPRVLVVVTHRDKGELEQSIRDRLKAEIAKRVLPAEIVEVAPVADDETICRSGFGIEALLDASVGAAPEAAKFWASTTPAAGSPAYIGYRRDR